MFITFSKKNQQEPTNNIWLLLPSRPHLLRACCTLVMTLGTSIPHFRGSSPLEGYTALCHSGFSFSIMDFYWKKKKKNHLLSPAPPCCPLFTCSVRTSDSFLCRSGFQFGPQRSNISNHWGFIKNANVQALPYTRESKLWGWTLQAGILRHA